MTPLPLPYMDSINERNLKLVVSNDIEFMPVHIKCSNKRESLKMDKSSTFSVILRMKRAWTILLEFSITYLQ